MESAVGLVVVGVSEKRLRGFREDATLFRSEKSGSPSGMLGRACVSSKGPGCYSIRVLLSYGLGQSRPSHPPIDMSKKNGKEDGTEDDGEGPLSRGPSLFRRPVDTSLSRVVQKSRPMWMCISAERHSDSGQHFIESGAKGLFLLQPTRRLPNGDGLVANSNGFRRGIRNDKLIKRKVD